MYRYIAQTNKNGSLVHGNVDIIILKSVHVYKTVDYRDCLVEPSLSHSIYWLFSCAVDVRCKDTTKSSRLLLRWFCLGDFPCMMLSNPMLSWSK